MRHRYLLFHLGRHHALHGPRSGCGSILFGLFLITFGTWLVFIMLRAL